MLGPILISAIFLICCPHHNLGEDQASNLISKIARDFQPGPILLAYGTLDSEVQSVAKNLAKSGWIGFRRNYVDLRDHRSVIGLNISLNTTCEESFKFTLSSKVSLLIPFHRDLMQCQGFRLDQNTFAFDFGGDQISINEIYGPQDHKEPIINRVMEIDQSSNEGFKMIKPTWDRRVDLQGMPIKLRTKQNSPWVDINPDGQVISGFLIDIIDRMKDQFNFTADLSVSLDNELWIDLVHDIIKDEYDLGLTNFNMDEWKNELLEFGRPLIVKPYQFHYCPQMITASSWTLLKPLRLESWMSLSAYFIIMTLVLSISYFIQPGSMLNHCFDSLGITMVTLIGKRVRVEPIHNSGRVLLVVALITGFLTFTMYKMMLAATLAIEIPHPPVESPEELLSSNKKVYVMEGEASQTFFSTAPSNSTFEQIHAKGQTIAFPSLNKFDEVLEGLQNGHLVFGDATYYPPVKICDLQHLDFKSIAVFTQAMIFPKNSQFKSFFDHHFRRIHPWIAKKHANWNKWREQRQFDIEIREPINLSQSAVIFFIFGVGIALSGLVFLLEHLNLKLRNT